MVKYKFEIFKMHRGNDTDERVMSCEFLADNKYIAEEMMNAIVNHFKEVEPFIYAQGSSYISTKVID